MEGRCATNAAISNLPPTPSSKSRSAGEKQWESARSWTCATIGPTAIAEWGGCIFNARPSWTGARLALSYLEAFAPSAKSRHCIFRPAALALAHTSSTTLHSHKRLAPIETDVKQPSHPPPCLTSASIPQSSLHIFIRIEREKIVVHVYMSEEPYVA